MCFGCGGHHEHEGREERGRLIGKRRPPCCTDLGVLAIFLMVQCAIIIVSALSYGEGNVWRVTNPVECVNGFTCGSSSTLGTLRDTGVSMDLIGRSPYIFFYQPADPFSLKSICVPSCTDYEIATFDNLSMPGNEYYCGYNGADQLSNIRDIINAEGEAPEPVLRFRRQADEPPNPNPNQRSYLYNDPNDPICAMLPIPRTTPFMNRCVLPNVVTWLRFDALDDHDVAHLASQQSSLVNAVNYFNDVRVRTAFHQIVHDLYHFWTDILWSFFVALFLGSIYLVLIHFKPCSLTSVVVGLFIAGSALLTAFLWRLYVIYFKTFAKKRSEQAIWFTDPVQKKNAPSGLLLLESQLMNEPVYLTLAIISSVGFLVMVPVTLSMIRRMRLSEKLFRELSKLIESRGLLLVAPFVTCGVVVIIAAHFYVTLAFSSTADRPMHANPNASDPIEKICQTPEVSALQYCWIILFAGVFWSAEMTITMQRVVVARNVCEYYFTRTKRRVPYRISDSLALMFKHHFGSLALAAVLIPACRVPRMLFGYVRKRFYEAAIVSGGGRRQRVATVGGVSVADGEPASSSGLSCVEVICSPCLGCQHGFFRFIDTSLLVYMAMRGYDVLKAARDSYFLLERNALRVSALSSASRFTLLVGKLSVAFTVTGIIVVFHQFSRDISTTFYLPNILFVWCLSYYVADCFFSFYEAAVDALLCCICEDLEVNDGTLAREYLMSVSLMDTIRTTSNALNKLSRHSRTEYAASIIIDHNLRRSQKYKKDKQLLSTRI